MCGDSVVTDPTIGDESVCNVPCRDDHNEFCGGLKLLKRSPLKERAQTILAAYSSSIISSLLPSITLGSSSAAIPSASIPGAITSSLSQSFSHYANTTSSVSRTTTASSQSVTTSATSSLPYGCHDLTCVSQSNAGRDAASSTNSLPFGCNSKFGSQISSVANANL